MEPIYSMKGIQDVLEVYEDRLTITPKGVLGLLNKGLKGTKTIPFSSITAIQYKEPGITNGYLQFTLLGGNESRGGVFAATKDENTFMFGGFNPKEATEKAREIKEFIEGKIYRDKKENSVGQGSLSISSELEKLAGLKNGGVISEEEFQMAKKQLLEK